MNYDLEIERLYHPENFMPSMDEDENDLTNLLANGIAVCWKE